MRRTSLSHQFVDLIPPTLEEGVVYVSIPYTTAVHLCACGCGTKVVTPISPAQWQLLYDGDTVSLTPSIGNWQFPCRSHYWIRRDQVQWARPWSDEEIAAGRQRDGLDIEAYFANRALSTNQVSPPPAREQRSFVRWLKHLFGRG